MRNQPPEEDAWDLATSEDRTVSPTFGGNVPKRCMRGLFHHFERFPNARRSIQHDFVITAFDVSGRVT